MVHHIGSVLTRCQMDKTCLLRHLDACIMKTNEAAASPPCAHLGCNDTFSLFHLESLVACLLDQKFHPRKCKSYTSMHSHCSLPPFCTSMTVNTGYQISTSVSSFFHLLFRFKNLLSLSTLDAITWTPLQMASFSPGQMKHARAVTGPERE